jgi:F0F1-type ATP synthase delta subunit
MKNKIKNLVELSYEDGQLNPEAVELIISRLSRKELKQYIRFLKQEENKKHVFVTSAKQINNKSREKIQHLFPKKQISYYMDPSMISGIKIVENDTEYEVNLDKTFHDIMVFLSKK